MTSSASSPSRVQRFATSFANVTFVARNAFVAYLTASAVRTVVRNFGHRNGAYRRTSAEPVGRSNSPITMWVGRTLSRSALPSRRNSGLTQTPNCPKERPDSRSRIGTTTDSVVPGTTVLLTTTVFRRPFRRAAPTPLAADSSWDVSMLPSSRHGVPTQRNAKSDPRTDSVTSVEAEINPRATSRRSSASSPASKNGALPRAIRRTRSESLSTHATRCPDFASAAAMPTPAAPAPMTAIRDTGAPFLARRGDIVQSVIKTITLRADDESRHPGGRIRHSFSPIHEGESERDAPGPRQACDPVRDRKGRAFGVRSDRPRHRTAQEEHRGSLRSLRGTRAVSVGPRRCRGARAGEGDRRPGESHVRPPERTSRARPCRAHGGGVHRRRAVRTAPG